MPVYRSQAEIDQMPPRIALLCTPLSPGILSSGIKRRRSTWHGWLSRRLEWLSDLLHDHAYAHEMTARDLYWAVPPGAVIDTTVAPRPFPRWTVEDLPPTVPAQ